MKNRLFLVTVLLIVCICVGCTRGTSRSVSSEDIPSAETAINQIQSELVTTKIPESIPTPSASMSEMAQLFQGIKPAEDGSFEVKITDSQATDALLVGQKFAQAAPTPYSPLLSSPAVTFSSDGVLFTGTIIESNETLTVRFLPYVQANQLQFEVIEASIGGKRVPAPVLKNAEMVINEAFSAGTSELPSQAVLEDVVLENGVMIIRGKINS